MGKRRISEWSGLYALLPLMFALMVIDVDAAVSPTWHRILLAGTAIVVCRLALSWVDRHPRLVERSGAGLTDSGEVALGTQVAPPHDVPVKARREPVPAGHNVTHAQG